MKVLFTHAFKVLLWLSCFSASAISSAINVSSVATAGDGSAVSPWTGWDTAITWVGEQQYNFPGGVYAFCNSPNFLKTGIALIGEAGTVLKHTGSGNAVVFDNPGGQTPIQVNWTQNVRMENFIIQGNVATTNGLFLRGVRNGYFKHLSVRDVSNAGIWTEACVTNILENFRVTHWEMPNGTFNVVPKYGIVFAARGPDTTTTWTVVNPVIEGVSLTGIWTQAGSYGHTFINGTSEGNLGKGAVIDSILNTFINTDFEANGGTDIEISNAKNTMINVLSARELRINAGAQNKIIGGFYNDIYIHPYAHLNVFEGMEWTGTFSDNDDLGSTIKFANIGPGSAGGYQLSAKMGSIIPVMLSLNFGPIVSTDCIRAANFSFFAFGNFTLANPVNPYNGLRVTWRIGQDNTGGRIISYGSKFRAKPGQSLPVLSTTPAAFDYIVAVYNQFRDTWDIQ